MTDEPVGPFSPIASVRPGRNRLPDEDRALAEARRRLHKKRQDAEERGENAGHHGHGAAHEDIHDDVSILGIPKEELTDNVRAAIDVLLEEIQHLRAELARAQSRPLHPEEQSEKDHTLHVMRRRAFLARVNFGVQRVADEHVQFGFIYIAITNAPPVRAQYGHGAAETLMIEAAEVLRNCLEPGDVLGSLEQFDFGVLLPGTSLSQAMARAARLVAALQKRSFVWQGQSITIEADFGVTELAPGDAAEDVITRAQAHRAGARGS